MSSPAKRMRILRFITKLPPRYQRCRIISLRHGSANCTRDVCVYLIFEVDLGHSLNDTVTEFNYFDVIGMDRVSVQH